MTTPAEQRQEMINNAMRGAYSPTEEYTNWYSLGSQDTANQLADIGVIGDFGTGAVRETGGGALGNLRRQRDIGLGRLGEDESRTNLLTRGSYGARGIFGSGLLTAQNRQNRQGFARQRDDLNLGFSQQSTDLLKRASDLINRFGIEQRQRYNKSQNEGIKTLNRLGMYSY